MGRGASGTGDALKPFCSVTRDLSRFHVSGSEHISDAGRRCRPNDVVLWPRGEMPSDYRRVGAWERGWGGGGGGDGG